MRGFNNLLGRGVPKAKNLKVKRDFLDINDEKGVRLYLRGEMKYCEVLATKKVYIRSCEEVTQAFLAFWVARFLSLQYHHSYPQTKHRLRGLYDLRSYLHLTKDAFGRR